MKDDFINILINFDNYDFTLLKKSVSTWNIKHIRWMATNHPDNRTRENLFRLSNVEVGENTVINYGMFIYDSYEPLVKIGARCAIAANVSMIAESNPNMSRLADIPFIEKFILKMPIVIEDDVWIGDKVIIFPGVVIGEKSIIGAGSIVTKSIPKFSIAKGQPAKVVSTIL